MTDSANSLIYLASASPRRSALLSQMGVAHLVRPGDVDETALAGESPADYVVRLARAKAQSVWDRMPERDRLPVLGADTTVALDQDILGKPLHRAGGLAMLRRLSARTHQVYTSVALCSHEGVESRLSVSDVTFRALSEAEMAAYWSSGEPLDKAGGYAIQGRAAVFIERIAGSYSGIVGLPLFETAQLLERIGWTAFGYPPPIDPAVRHDTRGVAR